MKTLSLKLDDTTFMETETIITKLNMARNRYINEAVHVYNLFNKKKLLKKQLRNASVLTRKDAMLVLEEFENLIDED